MMVQATGRKLRPVPRSIGIHVWPLRLYRTWCDHGCECSEQPARRAEENGQQYDFVLVDQIGFTKHHRKPLPVLARVFWNSERKARK